MSKPVASARPDVFNATVQGKLENALSVSSHSRSCLIFTVICAPDIENEIYKQLPSVH
jgi:hypothetical protein